MKILIKAIILFILVLQIYSEKYNCGGNCPSDECDYCPCGNTSSQININSYCQLMINGTNADINCCKCIIGQTSKGNQKYVEMSFLGEYIGIIPFPQNYFEYCASQMQDLCSWRKNAICVNKFYKNLNYWSLWEIQAKACGCPVQDKNKQNNLVSQKTNNLVI